MGKTKDYLIEQINKNPDKYQELIDYEKFKESLEACRRKLSRCDNENIE